MKDHFIQRPKKRIHINYGLNATSHSYQTKLHDVVRTEQFPNHFSSAFWNCKSFEIIKNNFVINSTIALMPCFWWNWLYFYIWYPNKIYLIYVLYARISVRNRIIFIIFFDDEMIHTQSLAQLFCLSNDVNEWKSMLRII